MNPYPGLRPFGAAESDWFFGREGLNDILETRVHISPVTVLFARSGVGKSSFLSCRFIPGLADRARVAYLNEWGAVPAENAIRSVIEDLAREGDDRAEKPVVVLDQFEDVFKLGTNRDGLWDTLAEFTNVSPGPVSVLISMREEWLGAWGESSDYIRDSGVSMIRLAPLRDSEALRAIMRPAVVEGSRVFSPELGREIAEDVKTPNAYGLGARYVEPGLIQIVCRRLWDEAEQRGLNRIESVLYDDLGRADEIVRDFVWRQLRQADTDDTLFSAFDRAMFACGVPHLSAAHGVKAIVTPVSLSKKLRLSDLGVAGPAILDFELSRKERAYVAKFLEKRGDPPTALVTWITRVLNEGTEAGLLKRQHGVGEGESLYELSHDSLSPILQQFIVEFEGWVRARWYKLVGGLFGALFFLPIFFIFLVQLGPVAFLYVLVGIVALAVYFGVFWVLRIMLSFVWEFFAFPVLRWTVKGNVPEKRLAKMRRNAR